jgi:hypothetical protein
LLAFESVEPVGAEQHALDRRLDGVDLLLGARDLRERRRHRLSPGELARRAADRATAGVGIGLLTLADADEQDGLRMQGLVPRVRDQEELAALALRAGR